MSEREKRLKEILDTVKGIYDAYMVALDEAQKKLKRART
jgi:hypothetical protein